METIFTEMILAAITAAAIILMEHYWLPNRLHITMKYALGILAIQLPLSVLLAVWQSWMALAALWMVSALAGLATLLSHHIDAWRITTARVAMAEHEAILLKREVADGPTKG